MLSEISWTQKKKSHVFFHIHNVDFRKRQYLAGDRKMRATVLNIYKAHYIHARRCQEGF